MHRSGHKSLPGKKDLEVIFCSIKRTSRSYSSFAFAAFCWCFPGESFPWTLRAASKYSRERAVDWRCEWKFTFPPLTFHHRVRPPSCLPAHEIFQAVKYWRLHGSNWNFTTNRWIIKTPPVETPIKLSTLENNWNKYLNHLPRLHISCGCRFNSNLNCWV